ncbi:sigma-54-dependent Fis family transcriptional regulator [Azospirillum sp. RWY-5-1]|uniref:Sigma-54-dependent Fis family transcriptional regulator n=1 Tax=Azospirillum oleiclasticum TaxID=2735135 RepID=A0ABX2THN7_9PROT|nr:sigma-54 dependent transcriptional regulator [Azospirillum oleiclasticum]NYZ14824.1 sigma-54-dependent Fis family transcriptional regulator [Azospirillum oleiclasticum]NYZ22190.1 sigma-54-dependent Fis family transcriptional regulator [Azospirillum oleiclasticum]
MPRHDLPRVAIVEDDPIMGESLVERLSLEGYRPLWLTTGAAALEWFGAQRPDLLLCDIRLPDMTGEELFQALLPRLGGTPVMFMTGFGDIGQAVRLVRAGADDYLTKPFVVEEFLARIAELLRGRSPDDPDAALGRSPAIRQVEHLLRRVADVDSTLLISGESGVGKEVAAAFVHRISRRAPSPFMAVNCAAIPPDLIDSELFGHEKGAFTGAHALHRGYAERAGNGVLFLDEVGELPHPVQAKLLRLVQERVFFRVGGEKPLPFQARLVCATNADLDGLVRAGTFRRDLYYRLNVIPVAVPPLRERPDDVLPLLQAYLHQYAEAFGRPAQRLTPQAEAAALEHDWPGNVRELRNRIERAVVLATGPWISANDLFPERHVVDRFGTGTGWPPLMAVRDESERSHILVTLRRADGQLGRAADLLGVGRTTLWEKMRRLGIAAEQTE